MKMCQCSKSHKEYSCLDFLAHSMFTFDVLWGSRGTSNFGNSASAANNTRCKLPFRLSFRFLWLWLHWFGICLQIVCDFILTLLIKEQMLILLVSRILKNIKNKSNSRKWKVVIVKPYCFWRISKKRRILCYVNFYWQF